MFDLDRFKTEQRQDPGGFASALAEMREGRKRSHWIWFIFPQLAGLGSSPDARAFGLDGVEEALAYLRDDELRTRLLEISTAVAGHLRGPAPVPMTTLMGSEIDVLKLVSSMTLFEHAARKLGETGGSEDCGIAARESADLEQLARVAGEVLEAAEAQGFPPCSFTRARL
jgi:uncharacterized protein (DUF1810 family)